MGNSRNGSTWDKGCKKDAKKTEYVEQEAQLMLANRETDAFRGIISYVRYCFLIVSYSNFVPKTRRFSIDFKNVITLKSGSEVIRGY